MHISANALWFHLDLDIGMRAPAVPRAPALPADLIGRLGSRLRVLRRHAAPRRLAELDDHILADIGVSQDAVRCRPDDDPLLRSIRHYMDIPFWPGYRVDEQRNDPCR